MERQMTDVTTTWGSAPLTLLICSSDPALRALARSTFDDPGWYLLESGFVELPQLARSVQIDVAIVLGAAADSSSLVRAVFASAGASVRHVISVRHALSARDTVRTAMGR